MTKPRRSMVLVLVLLSLAIAAAMVAPLAAFSGGAALDAALAADGLRHRLAAESVPAVLATLLAADRQVFKDLERDNRACLVLQVGAVRVEVWLQDESAKLPLAALLDNPAFEWESTAVALARCAGLPSLDANGPTSGQSTLRWTGCLDDLFAEPSDAALFAPPDTANAWSQFVGLVNRQVHARRAAPCVLEAALADLRPGLGAQLAALVRLRPEASIAEWFDALALDEPLRRAAAQRLTDRTRAYSLLIRTTLDRDARYRYLVVDAEHPQEVWVNWQVSP